MLFGVFYVIAEDIPKQALAILGKAFFLVVVGEASGAGSFPENMVTQGLG